MENTASYIYKPFYSFLADCNNASITKKETLPLASHGQPKLALVWPLVGHRAYSSERPIESPTVL